MNKFASHTPKKLLVSAALAAIAAYIFVSLAIDRGNWLYYGLTLISIVVAGKSLWRGLKSLR